MIKKKKKDKEEREKRKKYVLQYKTATCEKVSVDGHKQNAQSQIIPLLSNTVL